MLINLWWVNFEVEYNVETECNIGYIVGWPYLEEDLASVIEEMEERFKVSVELYCVYP